MFLEAEIRDLQKLVKDERRQNQLLSEKLQTTERQLAVERLCVRFIYLFYCKRRAHNLKCMKQKNPIIKSPEKAKTVYSND